MPMLQKAEKKILAAPRARQRALARALRASLRLKRSAIDISSEFDFGLALLRKYHIILDKADATEFVSDLMQDEASIHGVRRELSEDAYISEYQRSVGKTGRTLLFTYAEIDSFFALGGRLEMPDKLKKLLA